MHARQVRANPSAVFAEPLKSAAGNLFPQTVQILLAIIVYLATGISKVFGMTLPAFQSGNETTHVAVPVAASPGTRTGP